MKQKLLCYPTLQVSTYHGQKLNIKIVMYIINISASFQKIQVIKTYIYYKLSWS